MKASLLVREDVVMSQNPTSFVTSALDEGESEIYAPAF
jgi:hypothetical protein